MLLGIVTLIRVGMLLKAWGPMLVTGRPLVVLGMDRLSLVPVYPVMVITPLFVVKLNWACTAAGSTKSSNDTSLATQASRRPGNTVLSFCLSFSMVKI